MDVLQNYLHELTYYVSSDIKETLKDVPIVTKKEFMEHCKSGDILLASTHKTLVKNSKKAEFVVKTMASLQGSPYNTSKIVLDKNYAAGYGIFIPTKEKPNQVRKRSISEVMKSRQEMCLLRVDTTPQNKKQAIKFVVNKIGLDYNTTDLYRSLWDHFITSKLFKFFKEKYTEEEIKELQRPLICSSLISLAYWSAGFKRKFNGKHPFNVWPRDLLLDKKTIPICRIEQEY